jgi:hypothetical protein
MSTAARLTQGARTLEGATSESLFSATNSLFGYRGSLIGSFKFPVPGCGNFPYNQRKLRQKFGSMRLEMAENRKISLFSGFPSCLAAETASLATASTTNQFPSKYSFPALPRKTSCCYEVVGRQRHHFPSLGPDSRLLEPPRTRSLWPQNSFSVR